MTKEEKLELLKQRQKQRQEYQKKFMKVYYQNNKDKWKKYRVTQGKGTPKYNSEQRERMAMHREHKTEVWQKAVNYHRYARAKRAGKDSFTLLNGSVCLVSNYSQSIRPIARKKA